MNIQAPISHIDTTKSILPGTYAARDRAVPSPLSSIDSLRRGIVLSATRSPRHLAIPGRIINPLHQGRIACKRQPLVGFLCHDATTPGTTSMTIVLTRTLTSTCGNLGWFFNASRKCSLERFTILDHVFRGPVPAVSTEQQRDRCTHGTSDDQPMHVLHNTYPRSCSTHSDPFDLHAPSSHDTIGLFDTLHPITPLHDPSSTATSETTVCPSSNPKSIIFPMRLTLFNPHPPNGKPSNLFFD